MAEEFVTMLDQHGKAVKVPRQRWAAEILPPALQRAWDDPEALYAVIGMALNQNQGASLLEAIRRLGEIAADPERPAVMEGIALIQAGQTEQAEDVFNRFVDRHGPTASILTNLAKIQHQRGERAQAEALLRRALSLDANLEAALVWYLSLQIEHGGKEAAKAALEQFAREPKNWRARLLVAERLLKQNRPDEAIELYRKIIAECDLTADGMTRLTGDLGRAGRLAEVVNLVLPAYQFEKHGPFAGMNLLQALIQQGLTTPAAELLATLQELKHPMLDATLADFATRLAQAKSSRAAGAAASDAPPTAELTGQVAAVPWINPIWMGGLHKPDWLLPPLKADAAKVAIFSLANLTRQENKRNLAAQLTCALPLLLAEGLRLRSDAASMCVVPVMGKMGPVILGTAWPLPQMLSVCPGEFQPDYVVCGALTRGSRGPKVELHVFRVRDREPIKTLRMAAADDFSEVAGNCQRELLACLGGVGVQPAGADILPQPRGTDAYVACLANLLGQALAAAGLLEPERLADERETFDAYFRLAESEADSPLPTLLAAAAMAAAGRYSSQQARAYKQPLLELIERQSQGNQVVRQIAPAVYKLLGETERLAAARTELENVGGAYAQWLAGL